MHSLQNPSLSRLQFCASSTVVCLASLCCSPLSHTPPQTSSLSQPKHHNWKTLPFVPSRPPPSSPPCEPDILVPLQTHPRHCLRQISAWASLFLIFSWSKLYQLHNLDPLVRVELAPPVGEKPVAPRLHRKGGFFGPIDRPVREWDQWYEGSLAALEKDLWRRMDTMLLGFWWFFVVGGGRRRGKVEVDTLLVGGGGIGEGGRGTCRPLNDLSGGGRYNQQKINRNCLIFNFCVR